MTKPPAGGDGIDRRDFLNGLLLAAGGTAVLGSLPVRALGAQPAPGWPADQVGGDPRMQRGGNQPSVFNVAHWLRDDRLTFGSNSVKIAKSPLDSVSGTFSISAEGASYDLIIVGSGISGLSAAYHALKLRPKAKILILDGQAKPGGNAARDDLPPLPVMGSTATAYGVAPYAPFLTDLYKDVGVQWEKYKVPDPFYSYFFDSQTPYALPGTRSWNLDTYGKGLPNVPYPANVVADLLAARQDLINWYNTPGGPTDPADASDPKYDWLSPLTFDQYLTQTKGFHPAVSDFYTRYAIDALAGTTAQASAYTGISFAGAEYAPCFAYPGGNSGIARRLLKYLAPGALAGTDDAAILSSTFNFAAMDAAANPVRVRQNALVLRGETGSAAAGVVYYQGGQFRRVQAKAVIFAGQAHTAHTCNEYMMGAAQSEAMDSGSLCPVVVANVAIKQAAPVVDLGYDAYWWGSKYWADFVVADWTGPNRNDPKRPTVLTFYGGNWAPPDEMPNERAKLLTTPFASYEQSLREDLARILVGRGFDFDRDVTAVYLYRWGHSMVIPKPGWPFGAPTQVGGQWIRTPSLRHVARAQLGRISFGSQDFESSPANESAIAAGQRTAAEAAGWM